MQCFKHILVGVDLAETSSPDPAALRAGVRGAVGHALWLAKLNGARLLFFAALHTTAEVLQHLGEQGRAHVKRTVEEAASRVLEALVKEAAAEGVEARGQLAAGEGWLEITRQVLRAGHDLVVVGTRETTGWRRVLFGNTALKLMRHCPCPVWVTRPGHGARPLRILVATGLRPGCERTLRLGLALGEAVSGPVHVLHVVEYPLDRLWSTGLPDAETAEYHRKVREAAEQGLSEQLRRAGHAEPHPGVEVHLLDGAGIPDLAIQRFIREYDIDLLAMGTIGRGGLAGVLIGNTAERLLQEVECSVLAVKPPEFKSSVTLG